MFQEELLNRDQGISVHRKQINTLLTEIYKKFFGRTSKLLTLPKNHITKII